jgi:DNA primase catalytic subunit
MLIILKYKIQSQKLRKQLRVKSLNQLIYPRVKSSNWVNMISSRIKNWKHFQLINKKKGFKIIKILTILFYLKLILIALRSAKLRKDNLIIIKWKLIISAKICLNTNGKTMIKNKRSLTHHTEDNKQFWRYFHKIHPDRIISKSNPLRIQFTPSSIV